MPPVVKVHTFAPVAAYSACTVSLSLPTYTTPSTTAGVDLTWPPSGAAHRFVSVDGAVPSGLSRVWPASKPNDCQERPESATPTNAATTTTPPRRPRRRVRRMFIAAAPERVRTSSGCTPQIRRSVRADAVSVWGRLGRYAAINDARKADTRSRIAARWV